MCQNKCCTPVFCCAVRWRGVFVCVSDRKSTDEIKNDNDNNKLKQENKTSFKMLVDIYN